MLLLNFFGVILLGNFVRNRTWTSGMLQEFSCVIVVRQIFPAYIHLLIVKLSTSAAICDVCSNLSVFVHFGNVKNVICLIL